MSSLYEARVADQPSMWRRARRDVVLLGAGNVGVVIAQLGFRSLLVTLLAPAAYGRLSLVLSIYNTVWILGASGLPNSVARYIATAAPKDDPAIIRSAVRAGIWPTAIAAVFVAVVSGLLLNSPLAFLFSIVGLTSLVYSLLCMGILRGRGRIVPAASIMPIAGASEFILLALVLLAGLSVTTLSAFGVFCVGNFIGLLVGIILTSRTAPRLAPTAAPPVEGELSTVPSSRQLLGFSLWLGAATVGVALLPLAVRLAAAFDSYTVVAMVDIALVLFTIPQRIGSVIVSAVVPHATRAQHRGDGALMISRRENFVAIFVFALPAAVVIFTPIVGWVFGLLGRPEYAGSAKYLALALLAGPARVLYGVVEGVLVARGEGRFLAVNSLSIALVGSASILIAAALGSVTVAFSLFAISGWAIYVFGLRRVKLGP